MLVKIWVFRFCTLTVVFEMVLLNFFFELLVTLMLLGKRWILGVGCVVGLCYGRWFSFRGVLEVSVFYFLGLFFFEGDVGESVLFFVSFSEIFWAIIRGVGIERGSFGCFVGGEGVSSFFLGWVGVAVIGREGDRGGVFGIVEFGGGEFLVFCFLYLRLGMFFFLLGLVFEK